MRYVLYQGQAHELTSDVTAMLQLSYPLLKASGGGSVVYISSVGGGPTAMFSGKQLCCAAVCTASAPCR